MKDRLPSHLRVRVVDALANMSRIRGRIAPLLGLLARVVDRMDKKYPISALAADREGR
jgi:hypothetical protein